MFDTIYSKKIKMKKICFAKFHSGIKTIMEKIKIFFPEKKKQEGTEK